jgi:chorismate mutase
MSKHDTSGGASKELAELRQKIDAIDDKIIALLQERIGVVGKVGELKRREHPGECPIRAGREAEMVRRVIEEFRDSPLLPAAAAAMWRTLIGASTSLEGALTLSVYATDTQNDFYWLAREYFGSFIPSSKQPHVKRVIGDVIDGKASVGIVPMLRSSDTSYWWTNLAQGGDAGPKIFAHLPFVYHGAPSRDASSCLAIARVQPEETGDDRSVFVLEADHNVSQGKLQGAFASAKLDANWISVAALSPASRHHLVEIKGFVTAKSESMQQVAATLGNSVMGIHFLGAYATPVVLSAKNPHSDASSNTPVRHVSNKP